MAQIKLTVVSDTKNAETSIKNLKTEIAALAKEYEKVSASSKKANPANDIGAVAKSTAANIETLRKSYANLLAQIKTLEKQYGGKIFENVKTEVDAHLQQIKNLTAADKENSQILGQLSKDYKKLSADVAQYRAEETKLATADSLIPKTGNSLSRLESGWANLANSIKNVEKYYPKGTFDTIKTQIDAQTKSVAALRAEYVANNNTLGDSSIKVMNDSTAALLEQRAAFDQTKNSAKNYHGTLLDTVSGFLKFQVSAMLVMKPLQLLQSALSSINETLVETEKVVVSLQRVLDETVASGEISSELYAIAENLGQSFDNVQEIAQNFAKAGLSWQDTLAATEAAVLALNVAELTATESSEGLIAVMQQFNYEASELTYVIDVLNKAADKSAVDTADLLVALQKTGSYASAANLSLEETVGLISALSEATAASGQNIGNALKSLFAYSSKASSLEMFASLSDDMKAVVDMYQIGNASILDVWEELADTMTNLSDAQADLLEQWSSESGLETELGAELGDVYDQLTGVYDTAGVYRKNYFIALLNNFDEVKEVMGEISDASGYTAEEQAKYMDTYEAKLNSLQAQWEELANDEQGWLAFKKGLLDIASGLLTAIEYTGGLRTVVLALGTALWIAFGDKIISAVKSFGTALKGLVTGFSSAVSAASAFQAALGWVGVAATAISLIAGAITQSMEAAEQAAEEARQAAIDSWNAVSEEATQLNELYQQYLKLSQITEKTFEQQEEWATVQKNLVDLLGTQAIKLADLTEGTEEYRKKIEELTQSQLQLYAATAKAAANAAEETFENTEFSDNFFHITDKQLAAAAKKEDFNIRKIENPRAKGWHVFDLEGSAFEQATQLEEFMLWLRDVGYDETDLYNKIVAAYEERINAINTLFDTVPASEYYDYVIENGFVDTQAEFDEVVNRIMESVDATEDWRDEIEGLVSDYSGFNKELEESDDNYDDQIKKIEYLEDHGKALAEALQAIRDAEAEAADIEEKRLDIAEAREELAQAELEAAEKLADVQEKLVDAQEKINEERLSLLDKQKELQEELASQQDAAEEKRLDLLEKQQAVLEAQKALEEARNNRSVWRYNEATGQFEWVTDESAVKDAEEEVASAEEAEKEAQTAYNEALQAVEDAKAELEDINLTIQDAEKAIEEAIAQGYDISREILEEEKNVATGVRDAIQEYINAQQAIKDQEAENAETIANAQDKVQEAIDAFNEYIEDQAWDGVIAELESGNATNKSIKEILDKWKETAETQAEADTAWYQQIIAAIKENSGVDLSDSGTTGNIGSNNSIFNSNGVANWAQGIKPMTPQEKHDFEHGNYDNGGVANGLGYLAKATAEPEAVNNPELTAKILSPTSNAQFDRYVRDMGILFETARDYAAIRPIMQSTVGNTTTTNNNSNNTYAISNVKIGSDMLSRPFGEVLQMMTLVPRKS